MNLYNKEIKRNLKSTMIWTVSMALLNVLQMAVFPSMIKQTKSLEELVSKLPKELVAAFGMDKLSMTDVLGYYGTKCYTLLLLLGAMFSIILCTTIFIREKDGKTMEFLLSKPITRNQMVTEKLTAGISLIVLFNLVVSIATYISFELYKDGQTYDLTIFLLLCAGSLILNLLFGAIGACVSSFFSRGKSVISLSIGVVLFTYFIGILASSAEKFEKAKYLSPFKYVESVGIILDKKIDPVYMTIATVSFFVFIIVTYIMYNRQDIVS